jgi:hypothetical protein
MGQEYSDPKRASDPHALPDIEVFQLSAREVAERDEDLIREWMKKHEYRLASMNRGVLEKMFDAMIEAESIQGGYFYWFCFPGCLPNSEPIGPFETYQQALDDARQFPPSDDDSPSETEH